MSDTQNVLAEQVKNIVNLLENGVTYAYCGADHEERDAQPDDIIDGFEYLSDVLDITYIVESDRKTLKGARLLVAFGGPNIWIDTVNRRVEGYWWGDTPVIMDYSSDAMDIDSALEELWAC
jgi:hypothetical protein